MNSFKGKVYSYLKKLKKVVFKPYLVCILSRLILLYQKYLSKHTCLYSPTCSQYMLESLHRYGFLIGLIMGIFRILRCNPLSKGGYDPVPEKFWILKWVI